MDCFGLYTLCLQLCPMQRRHEFILLKERGLFSTITHHQKTISDAQNRPCALVCALVTSVWQDRGGITKTTQQQSFFSKISFDTKEE